MKVFLSHATEDWDLLQALVSALETRGLSIWHSERDIRSGDFQARIANALETVDWVLVAASPNATESEWVKSEAHIAFQLKPECVLGLMLRDCKSYNIHLHLPRMHFVSLARPLERVVDDIAAALLAPNSDSSNASADWDNLRNWGAELSVAEEAICLARSSSTIEQFA